MRHLCLYGLFTILAYCTGCNTPAAKRNPGNPDSGVADDSVMPVTEQAAGQAADDTIPAGVNALLKAYPDFISGWDGRNILFTDGTSMPYDDGKEKTFEQRLDNSDIEDMFADLYKEHTGAPEYLSDAGRSRCEALFKKMYGDNSAAVQKNLVTVKWIGENVRFTRINGAADSLRNVGIEFEKYPGLRKYLKSSGTFYWRKVRGANRQSAHSYGIAFDIGVNYSDYWKCNNPDADESAGIRYVNRIPKQIADIFHRHGFIWGGNWYHYDTMHFEFRPELLNYAGNL